MIPTHRHSDGGIYEFVEPCSLKDDVTGEWVEGVAYRGEDGKLRSTSLTRWEERFTALNCKEIETRDFTIQDDEGSLVCSFVFQVFEAADVRLMLISEGYSEKFLPPQQQSWIRSVLQAQAEMVTQGLHLRDHDFPDLLGDVNAFHAYFGQEYTGKPRVLPEDLFDFRVKFHDEETTEYRDEQLKLEDAIARKDRRDIIHHLELQLDALCDAVWVLLGTADLQFGRAAFFEAWKRVVKANMAKVRVEVKDDGTRNSEETGRAPKYDIGKPPGWLAPDHRDLVQDNAVFDELFASRAPDVEINTFNQARDNPVT